MLITVDEMLSNSASSSQLVKQWASTEGKFHFTAAESGDHKICFSPSQASSGGWLSGGQHLGTIKMVLDLAIGETSEIESSDKPKIDTILQKVKDLKSRLEDIKREQVFQRVCISSRSGDGDANGAIGT
jgi:p24 family protein alpha